MNEKKKTFRLICFFFNMIYSDDFISSAISIQTFFFLSLILHIRTYFNDFPLISHKQKDKNNNKF